MLLWNLSMLCRTQTENQIHLTSYRFVLRWRETHTVCLKRWAQSFPRFRDEPFWKINIRILYISSIKIRYCYSSQVDPECSGWSNTIAAFFLLFFLISHFFSPIFLFFFFYLSLHVIHNHTNTQTHTICNALTPFRLNISSFLPCFPIPHWFSFTKSFWTMCVFLK